mmetsp:Transcript_39848/g.110760  ORF Transcript_39848/g.110760 Transcript_39848/m.110760 type:complete len:235 (+) Transcript_39848:1288-1992(+)
MALLRVHTSGLRLGDLEELVVKQLYPINVLCVPDAGLADRTPAGVHGGVHEALGVGVVILLVIPAVEWNVADVVDSDVQRLPQRLAILSAWAVRRHAADRHWQVGVPEVLGPEHALPSSRHTLMELIVVIKRRKHLQPVLSPVVQLLDARDAVRGVRTHGLPAAVAGDAGQHDPGAESIITAGGGVPACDDVAAEYHQHVRPRLDRHGLCIVVDGDELQGAIARAHKVHHHQLG